VTVLLGIWRSTLPPTAQFLTGASGPVSAPVWEGGAWYWLESAGAPASRLVRFTAGVSKPIALAPGLAAFGVGEGKIAWATASGSQWTIQRAATDGAAQATIWTGDLKPQSIAISEHRIFWIVKGPGLAPNCGPFAPLGSRIQVMAAPLEGGPATVVSEVTEPLPRQILGAHGGVVYFTVSRAGLQTVTVIYRCPSSGGPATRVAAETADQEALLTHDGTLYWTGASREAAQPERATCVRRLAADGRIESLQDWMPFAGSLYESNGRIYYIGGGTGIPDAWIIGGDDPLPKQAPMPEGFAGLAAGAGELLCESTSARDVRLYRVALP